MARKSAADFVVVPISGTGRPPPPAELDALERSIWKGVVDASPAHAIDPAAQVLLRRVVAQAAFCEALEGRLRVLRAEWAQDPDLEDEALQDLATAHAAAAKVVTFLLTSLRATPRSKTRLRTVAAKAARVPSEQPWTDGLHA